MSTELSVLLWDGAKSLPSEQPSASYNYFGKGACSLGANVTSNGSGALRAAGSGDAVLGYAIAEGETDVSVQVFVQG